MSTIKRIKLSLMIIFTNKKDLGNSNTYQIWCYMLQPRPWLTRSAYIKAILKYAQARRICPPKSQLNIWNRLTFLNQHLIFSRTFGRTFEWKFCENFWQPGIKSHRFEIQLLCVLISKNVKRRQSLVISRNVNRYIVSARFSVISELEPDKKIIHISISKLTMLS